MDTLAAGPQEHHIPPPPQARLNSQVGSPVSLLGPQATELLLFETLGGKSSGVVSPRC